MNIHELLNGMQAPYIVEATNLSMFPPFIIKYLSRESKVPQEASITPYRGEFDAPQINKRYDHPDLPNIAPVISSKLDLRGLIVIAKSPEGNWRIRELVDGSSFRQTLVPSTHVMRCIDIDAHGKVTGRFNEPPNRINMSEFSQPGWEAWTIKWQKLGRFVRAYEKERGISSAQKITIRNTIAASLPRIAAQELNRIKRERGTEPELQRFCMALRMVMREHGWNSAALSGVLDKLAVLVAAEIEYDTGKPTSDSLILRVPKTTKQLLTGGWVIKELLKVSPELTDIDNELSATINYDNT